jgi:hypothetical protein
MDLALRMPGAIAVKAEQGGGGGDKVCTKRLSASVTLCSTRQDELLSRTVYAR